MFVPREYYIVRTRLLQTHNGNFCRSAKYGGTTNLLFLPPMSFCHSISTDTKWICEYRRQFSVYGLDACRWMMEGVRYLLFAIRTTWWSSSWSSLFCASNEDMFGEHFLFAALHRRPYAGNIRYTHLCETITNAHTPIRENTYYTDNFCTNTNEVIKSYILLWLLWVWLSFLSTFSLYLTTGNVHLYECGWTWTWTRNNRTFFPSNLALITEIKFSPKQDDAASVKVLSRLSQIPLKLLMWMPLRCFGCKHIDIHSLPSHNRWLSTHFTNFH